MNEYSINALKAELSATQSSLGSLQYAVEQLHFYLQNHLPQDIAAAVKQALEDSKNDQGKEASKEG